MSMECLSCPCIAPCFPSVTISSQSLPFSVYAKLNVKNNILLSVLSSIKFPIYLKSDSLTVQPKQ